MEKFTIKNRFTQKIIVEDEAETLREVVEKNKANLGGADLWGTDLRGTNLGGADLGGADLWGTNLRGADLRGTNLRGADLRGAKIKITQKEDIIRALGIIIEE